MVKVEQQKQNAHETMTGKQKKVHPQITGGIGQSTEQFSELSSLVLCRKEGEKVIMTEGGGRLLVAAVLPLPAKLIMTLFYSWDLSF